MYMQTRHPKVSRNKHEFTEVDYGNWNETRTPSHQGLIRWRQCSWDLCCYNLPLSDHFAYETRNIQAGVGKRGFGWRNSAPLRPDARLAAAV